ncbi:phage scaffolding protein [Sediminibacillus massiliensis]|uniref:phage scaffolding protein n=1 Tax=Sediminibacillus massiliensis TaxID=1926277 RepID=UPI000988590F|nr:phage scaffolding protein [Sediminibacillus massiliensis]
MKREFLKELELEEEVINKIMIEHGKTVNDIKDKADKVDTLESQIENYKQQIQDRDTQLDELKEKAKGNEEMQQKIADLQKANEEDAKQWEGKLLEERKEAKLELALKDAKAKNNKAVKALIDAEKISLDGDNLIGLEEQLKKVQEESPYLFGEEETPKGRQPHTPQNPDGGGAVKNPFSKENLNLTEQGKIIRDDPEKAKQLISQAGGNPAIYGL